VTGKNCTRYVAHNDFQVPGRKYMHHLPGYFMMINGKVEFPLWVLDHSHKFATPRRFEDINTAGRCSVSRRK